jgi:hypothetical protein
MELTTCPECGAPAAILERRVLDGTDAPIEHAKVRCVTGHWFFLPVAHLARPGLMERLRRPVTPSRR